MPTSSDDIWSNMVLPFLNPSEIVRRRQLSKHYEELHLEAYVRALGPQLMATFESDDPANPDDPVRKFTVIVALGTRDADAVRLREQITSQSDRILGSYDMLLKYISDRESMIRDGLPDAISFLKGYVYDYIGNREIARQRGLFILTMRFNWYIRDILKFLTSQEVYKRNVLQVQNRRSLDYHDVTSEHWSLMSALHKYEKQILDSANTAVPGPTRGDALGATRLRAYVNFMSEAVELSGDFTRHLIA